MKKLIWLSVAVALLCGCTFTRSNSGQKGAPAEPADETELYGDDDFYEDYTWSTMSLKDRISLMYDTTDYSCEVLDKSGDELAFVLRPQWAEAGDASARIRFVMADRRLDIDSDAWEEALQDALDPLMDALEEDRNFELDGRFSPWYNLDSDYGTYIRYMGTRVPDDRYVEGAFAAKGYQKGRALMQAEAEDEETLEILLDLFDTVSFDF
jgi:hypothetical protein